MSITYVGTTFGSTSANPPSLLFSGVGSFITASVPGARVWKYNSTNAAVDMTAPAAFLDGALLGMKVGDLVLGVTCSAGSSAGIAYMGVVGLVTTSSGAALSSNVITSTAV